MGGQGRTTPLTVILPVPRWWALWLRLMWARARLMQRLRRGRPNPLAKLASISFAHWALTRRPPPGDERANRRLPRWYLVFQTNFGGRMDPYLETFCFAIPWIMRGLWWGIYRTPGIRPVGRFQRYVADVDRPAAHYYCAYPDASPRMVTSALGIRRRFDDLVQRAAGLDPEEFEAEYRSLLASMSLSEPSADAAAAAERAGFCALTRIRNGRQGTLLAELVKLPTGSDSPLARMEEIHVARWVVVPYLEDRHGHPIDSASYLLFSSEFDGPLEAHLERLSTCLGPDAHAIWSNCAGCPDTGNELARYLLDHRVRPGYSFAGYPEASVAHIRDCLGRSRQLMDFAVEACRLEAPALQDAWRTRFPVTAP